MLVGKRISDRYKILELIGGGGMSNVYLAHDMILNRDVAIKILRYDFSNEDELHRRFQREALSATSLTHPNIVSVYDVGDDGDLHYIVMEYVQGKTLKQYIQEFAPISPARSVHIMKQLTSAIANAHENHIIHRDIKPQNILMDAEGNVKITDFGIAMTLSATSFTQTNSVLGTVHYLSPEQARGGTATNQSDIYALGIVLYELLTGELPFSGESAVSIALKHLQAETPSVRAFDGTIPQSLENVVLKATAKAASHRYNTVEEMYEDLETVLSSSRINEPKFVIPVDNDATKAIPIIKEEVLKKDEDLTKTRVIEPIVDYTSPAQAQPKKPVEKPIPAKAKKKKWPKFVAGLLIAVIIIFLFFIFAADLFSPKKIAVPDVTNLTVEDATKKLVTEGFVVAEEHQERNHEDIEKGHVIETDPEKNSMRAKGSEIDLIVSLGVETTTVDNYVGQNYSQVEALIKGKYKEVRKEEVPSREPEGRIIEQSIPADTEVIAKEETMTFKVSQGVRMVRVESVVNYTKADMDNYVNRVGLNWRVSREDYHETIPAGSVISQLTKAGTMVEEGSVISVVISKGPAKKPEKLLLKPVVIEYKPKEEGVPQKVRIEIQDKNHTFSEPVTELEILNDTPYNIQLVIEEGKDASYRIIRDSEIILEEKVNYNDVN
ncbi:Stk1 family PASTA domain-containing Ser/Thr kinase [Lysinibacillus sphaericus]|uniref:Serine/threonine-protein kinase PrkC n=3 Tax=Lysinibacillus TaxID=400634 RepID=B1HQE8_LYSSC|nr:MULTISPECIES: Stk1 family PASTA domain-containing Ser/Thr kinase [Lysinibacillus]MBE5085082.1 Stk1 family PASTA domain-containing Ser/Thr kinase [Bacillus thuringiensis]ACA39095.1 Serine/threonine-protein kinase prkC [Lysinibacillus sphaericus C3-41]AMO34684.1 serine/threonine protein kinase [Lysinibacillus sphaericus]AMR90199.1 serine/threonine protein kinase [Lysinibacillus sphaericus]ANA44249.1 serine/threonine protein kinase [Lysinibacillus sphaericus]